MTVYIVSLKTSGERWHTCVCGSEDSVVRVLLAHGIDEEVYSSGDGVFRELVNSKDRSQSATVGRTKLID